MGRQQHGTAALAIEAAEQSKHFARRAGVEIAGRLVGQPKRRIGDQRAGDFPVAEGCASVP